MLAGIAAADITPLPGLMLQGHFTTQASRGVLYPLEIRAIAFGEGEKTVCLITVDVIGVSRETTQRVRHRIKARTEVAGDHIAIFASHTHCAPAMVDLLGMVPDAGFMERVEEAAAECAIEAIGKMRPVTLGVGCSAAHFNVNRRPFPGATGFSVNYGGVCDKRVRVLRVDDVQGNVIAVLFHYACHPTTLPGSEGMISPDYPGIARGRVEYVLNCRAMFLPGCFGNIRPLILNEAGEFTAATKKQLDDCGQELAAAVLGACENTQTRPANILDARELELTLPFGNAKSVSELDEVMRETAAAAVAVKIPWARRVREMMDRGSMPVSEKTAMQFLRIGPVSMVTIPGEPVQEIGHAVERRLNFPDIWPVGYANDMVGYLVTERQKLEGGYEPNAYPLFNRSAPFEEEERRIVEKAIELSKL